MRYGQIAVIGALIALSGCAGSQSELRLLESDNSISVMPATSTDYDYVVSIRNTVDFGYNPDDKATRDSTALRMLQTQCPAATVVGETVIDTGTYLGGRPSRTYAVQVKCNAAAPASG